MVDTSVQPPDSPRDPLRLTGLYRSAVATYRARFARVAGIAIAVFLVPALLSSGIDQWAEHHGRHLPGVATVLIIAGVIGAGMSVFSATFYAGVLDEAVGEYQHGHPRRSIADLLRRLPYVRLIVASLLVSVATGVAALAFVIPGMIVYTFLALTGPLINIEKLGVVAAFRRSFYLVRPKFWLTLCAVTVPVAIESWLDETGDLIFRGAPWLAALALDGLLAITLLAGIGLIEVTLTYELIERDR